MAESTHYEILNVKPTATQAEIKQAYRRLVKLFHPDSASVQADPQHMARINAAYEVIGDPERRQSYDRLERSFQANRQQRTEQVQQHHRRSRCQDQDSDADLRLWLERIYLPISRVLGQVLGSLAMEIDSLAADPFDDELMGFFQDYLQDCRHSLHTALTSFQSMPNPPSTAGLAALLYYCLNHLGDGVDELERFTTSYHDRYLHTGQELFRIAAGIRKEAQAEARQLGQRLQSR